jgi:pyrroline-5-carboxylate reductase
MLTVGFIGAGNMGMALLKGFAPNLRAGECAVSAFDPVAAKQDELRAMGIAVERDETAVVRSCQYIVLAVKPQLCAEVLKRIKPAVNEKNVIISICAGISSSYIRDILGEQTKVIPVMPNTAMMLGKGSSAIARESNVTDEEFATAKSIIGACGAVEEIPADKMNEVICLNSSSPAYIYLFAKAFVDYAVDHGIESGAAHRMFAQNLIGAAAMITESGKTLDEMIKQVCAPAGTTIAGMQQLTELPNLVKNACDACTKRAYELGK